MNSESKNFRLSGLDEIRSIACLLVLIGHINHVLSRNFDLGINWKPFHSDKEGVTIFFVLSGFIITYRILSHYIHIKNGFWLFVKNRMLRIMPLYFIYLFIVSFAILLYNTEYFEIEKFVYYIFLIPNILESGLPYLHHYWSLGVEEQFYFTYPFLLFFIAKYPLRVQLAVLILAYVVLQSIRMYWIFSDSVSKSTITEFGFHFIVTGCIGGFIFSRNMKNFTSFLQHKFIQITAIFLLLLLLILYYSDLLIIHDIIGLSTLVLILGLVGSTNQAFKTTNNTLRYLGKISYSVYVWHPLVIAVCIKSYVFFFGKMHNFFEAAIFYTAVITFTIFISHLSYKFIESYFYFTRKNALSV